MYNILVSCHIYPLNITAITFAKIGHEDLLLYGFFFKHNKFFFFFSFFHMNNYTDKLKYTLPLCIRIEVKKPSTRTPSSYKLIIHIYKNVESYYQTSERAISHIFISYYKCIVNKIIKSLA